MRKIRIWCLVMAILFVLCACDSYNDLPQVNSQEGEENDPFVIGGGNSAEPVTMGYKFGLTEYPEEWVYTGEEIQFSAYYQNGSFALETGFLIFVDGIPQEYTIPENSERKYMHYFDLAASERKVIPISFTPNIGKVGDTLNLQFVSILEPSYIAEQNESYGNNHRLLELMPSTLYFETDAVSALNGYSIEKSGMIGNEIQERYSLPSASAAETHNVKLYDVFDDSDVFSKENGSAELTLEALGGKSAEYRVSVFVDNIPAKINGGYDYLQYRLKEGCYVSEKIDLAVDNSANKHCVYAISVPVGADTDGTIQISNSNTLFPIGTEEIITEETSEPTQPTDSKTDMLAGNIKITGDVTRNFNGLVVFCEKIGDCIFTVEDYCRLVKYSLDYQLIESVEFAQKPDINSVEGTIVYHTARALDNGIAIFTGPFTSIGRCTVYDTDLNAKEIDIYSLLGADPDDSFINGSQIDISYDGRKITYVPLDETGIHVYDIDSGTGSVFNSDNGISFVSVKFTPDGNIAYTAGSWSGSYSEDNDKEYIGIVSSSGEIISRQRFDNCEYAGSADNSVIFDERNVVAGMHSSGRVYKISDGGEITEIILNDPDESQHAILSPSGERLLTYIESGDNSIKFTLYKNGNSEKKWQADFDLENNAFVRTLTFLDEHNVLVVFALGTDQMICVYEL